MKKLNQVMLLSALIGVFCFASQAKEIISNGDFKQLVKKKAKYEKAVIGEKFIKSWGLAGGLAEVIIKEGEPNRLILKSGVIYSFLIRHWPALPAEVEGEIVASGVGKMKIQLSTCVKKEARQAFRHVKKTVVGEFVLGKEVKTFKFKYKIEAGEVGYIYIYAINGPLIISQISAKTVKIEK
jgi:hypothetical protein